MWLTTSDKNTKNASHRHACGIALVGPREESPPSTKQQEKGTRAHHAAARGSNTAYRPPSDPCPKHLNSPAACTPHDTGKKGEKWATVLSNNHKPRGLAYAKGLQCSASSVRCRKTGGEATVRLHRASVSPQSFYDLMTIAISSLSQSGHATCIFRQG